ncbi:MAG: competence type IV pilus major pilin ComGC [Armatimonadota bacterium]
MNPNSRRTQSSAFTLVEILVVVFIISLLLMIAVPNFRRAAAVSGSRVCVKNLWMIHQAKDQYVMENKISASDPPVSMSQLAGPGKFLKKMPECPSGGTYSAGGYATEPTCTIGATGSPEHKLP